MGSEAVNNRFSFIIPVYNAQKHIGTCLQSIRNQVYPQADVEIIIADGGSVDDTLKIAKEYSAKIINNPKRLAEYGVQAGIACASGGLVVIFAADNELVGNNWLSMVNDCFFSNNISAAWGRLVSGKNDTQLNKYFELIQSDPLNWFLNGNLRRYIKKSQKIGSYCVFQVNPAKPLVWGANGLVFRRERIAHIWQQEGYLGDNDAFQTMIEEGSNTVAYFDQAFVYHHHVARLNDWIKKWKRNFIQHLLSKQETRNMNWAFAGNFKPRLFFWAIYSAIPVLAFMHSLYLMFKEMNAYWLYHPVVSCAQFWTYFAMIFSTKEGRNFIKKVVLN